MMIITVFRSRLRSDAGQDYQRMAARTEAAAREIEGFASFKTFRAPDGETVSIVEFETLEAHRAWRDHPLHREAQASGRDRWYDDYDIKVAEVLRAHHFSREP